MAARHTKRRDHSANRGGGKVIDNNDFVKPHKDLDVYVQHEALDPHLHESLKQGLAVLASTSSDFRGNHYQNLLDPNLYMARVGPDVQGVSGLTGGEADEYRWIAAEFEVKCPIRVDADEAVSDTAGVDAELPTMKFLASPKSRLKTLQYSCRLKSPIQDLLLLTQANVTKTKSPSGDEKTVSNVSCAGSGSGLAGVNSSAQRSLQLAAVYRALDSIMEKAWPVLTLLHGAPAPQHVTQWRHGPHVDRRFPVLPHYRRWETPPHNSTALPLLQPPYHGKLQAVLKAQRVLVAPGEKYESVWHQEGLHESILAVVLYYYHSDTSGGALRFAERGDVAVPLDGLEESPEKQAELAWADRKNVQVQPREGTLVVFNNYNLVHKVQPMYAAPAARPHAKKTRDESSSRTGSAQKGSRQAKRDAGQRGQDSTPRPQGGKAAHDSAGTCSRDFLALFVVDPRYPCPNNSRSGLLLQAFMSSTGSRLNHFPVELLLLILEYAGEAASLSQRLAVRDRVFARQMEPQRAGRFAVYCAGNFDLKFATFMETGIV